MPIHGANELCCVSIDDCMQAMNKGLANSRRHHHHHRSQRHQRPLRNMRHMDAEITNINHDDEQQEEEHSHIVWQLRMDQVDTTNDTVTTSFWRIIELAGSEASHTAPTPTRPSPQTQQGLPSKRRQSDSPTRPHEKNDNPYNHHHHQVRPSSPRHE